MTHPLINPYRLTPRGGLGLSCDGDGVALGPVTLIEKLARGGCSTYRLRPAEEVRRAITLAYGASRSGDIARHLAGLDVAARALEAGDMARAAVATVQLKLPDLTPTAFAKLAADRTLMKYSPDQPRDEKGRWTSWGDGDDSGEDVTATSGSSINPRAVHSLSDGKVIVAGWQDPNNHASDPSTTPRVGTTISRGDYIGDYADPTNGHSTGPDVHVQLNDGPNSIDPGAESPLGVPAEITTHFTDKDETHPKAHQGVDWKAKK